MTPDHAPSSPDPQATPTFPGATLPQNDVAPSDGTPTVAPAARQREPLAVAPPGYEIIGTLGRGGMGVVYHARQTKLNREVALKMILSGGHASDEDRQRFLAEGHAIAALNHPGIVQVYEFGEYAGQPYFALEFCPGGSLAKQLDGTPLKGRAAARIIQRLAHAVQAAHDKGIVHRDLKPANVLIADCEFRIADSMNDRTSSIRSDASLQSEIRDPRSAIKITDFGLAKRLESESDLTRSGAIVGTPSYMAPEQAGGNAKEVGPAADVYALGAILYELLTGRPPFKEARAIDTVLRVINDEPISISHLQKNTPLDLETICHKCLRKEPRHRYPSAKELGRDLGRWLDGEPIQARPVGRIEKAVKWARRRPAVAALIATIVFATLALVGGSIWYSGQLAQKETTLIAAQQRLSNAEVQVETERKTVASIRTDVENERINVRRLNEEARINLARSNLILADGKWKDHDALGTIKALGQVPRDLRHWEWRYQQRRALGAVVTLWGHTGSVETVTFNSDGTLVASGSQGCVKLWDAKNGTCVRTLNVDRTQQILSLAFSPDQTRLAASTSNNVCIWDLKIGSQVQSLEYRPLNGFKTVYSVAYSPVGTLLAGGCYDGTIRIWDTQTSALVRTLARHEFGLARGIAFSPNGTTLASGGNDRKVKLWDVKTGVVLKTLTGHTDWVSSVAFSPDGARLATSSADQSVIIWDSRTGAAVQALAGHTGSVSSVTFSPDGTRLATASDDKSVKLWNANGGLVQTLTGHTERVLSVAFSPDGARLATGGRDYSVRIWDTRYGFQMRSLNGHTQSVRSIAVNRDGDRLATGSSDNTVKLWDARTGRVLKTMAGHTHSVTSVAFNPDGAQLASTSLDYTIKLWDAKTGAILQTLTGHRNFVNTVSFSPDGARLASGSDDYTVNIWDAKTGKLEQILTGHRGNVCAVAFSHDGTRMASGSFDGTARIWDTKSWTVMQTTPKHPSVVWCLAFSPDGTQLASGSINQIKIWNTESGVEVKSLLSGTSSVKSLAFSPDGARLVSGGEDRSLKLWDPKGGSVVQTLQGHTREINSVAFCGDGARIISGSADCSAIIWDSNSRSEVQAFVDDDGQIMDLALSPDGARLASSCENTVKLWDTLTGTVVRTIANDSVARNLAFSPDGRRVAALVGTNKVWDLETGNEIVDAGAREWHNPRTALAHGPNGQYVAIHHLGGTILLARTMPPDEFELGYRAWFARPDPDWHWQQAQKFEKDQSWFAAKVHCEQVLKSRPDDAAAKALLEKAKGEWEKVKPKDAAPTKP